jgi:hypothetical protein
MSCFTPSFINKGPVSLFRDCRSGEEGPGGERPVLQPQHRRALSPDLHGLGRSARRFRISGRRDGLRAGRRLDGAVPYCGGPMRPQQQAPARPPFPGAIALIGHVVSVSAFADRHGWLGRRRAPRSLATSIAPSVGGLRPFRALLLRRLRPSFPRPARSHPTILFFFRKTRRKWGCGCTGIGIQPCPSVALCGCGRVSARGRRMGYGVLLTLHINGDKFLCVFF